MTLKSLDDVTASRNGAAVVRRLRWLDDRLQWHGFFRRSDLVARFGISPQQATTDIAMYLGFAPGNARLDPARKVHLRGMAFQAKFDKDPFQWIAHATQEGDGSVIPCESLPMPGRRMDPAIIAAIFHAYETRTSMRITYQSMSTRTPSERVICPHHVVDIGDRVHVRAWDDKHSHFRDFLLVRIKSAVSEETYPWVDGVADTEWLKWVDIVVGPHKELSQSQRAAVEADYGMTRGKVAVRTRRALVIYTLDQLGLLEAVRDGDGTPEAVRGISCLNASELRSCVPGSAPDR